MSGFDCIGVVGAGAWGTALADLAVRAGRRTVLWGRDPRSFPQVDRSRDPGLEVTAVAAHLAAADALLMVVPAQAMRDVAAMLAPLVTAGVPIVSCAKGLERGSLATMTAVLQAVLPGHPVAALSGPSFAADVRQGLPTAVTLAAADATLAAELAGALATPAFRLYHSTDVIGVEIGGAAKNVLAIAAGIAAGRGLGASAGAALVARGFAELRRLGAALGARPETLMGLSGLGDLVLTATSPLSRNFAFGQAIGAGMPPPPDLAEGCSTADALVALAAAREVEMPIAAAVRGIVAGDLSVAQAMEALLARPLRAET